jgi:Ulp1 family protease
LRNAADDAIVAVRGKNVASVSVESLKRMLDPAQRIDDQSIFFTLRSLSGVYVFDSLFFEKLYDARTHTVRCDAVRSWRRSDGDVLRAYDTLYFVVHVNTNHWTLVVYDKSSNTLYYLDSMGDDDDRAWRDRAAERMGAVRVWLASKRCPDIDAAKTKLAVVVGLPKQDNDVDCGIFLLVFADCLANGVRPEEARALRIPSHVRRIRKRLALNIIQCTHTL